MLRTEYKHLKTLTEEELGKSTDFVEHTIQSLFIDSIPRWVAEIERTEKDLHRMDGDPSWVIAKELEKVRKMLTDIENLETKNLKALKNRNQAEKTEEAKKRMRGSPEKEEGL